MPCTRSGPTSASCCRSTPTTCPTARGRPTRCRRLILASALATLPVRARCRRRRLQHRVGARARGPARRARARTSRSSARCRRSVPLRRPAARSPCGRRLPRPRATTCAASSTPSPPTSRPIPSRRSGWPRRSRPATSPLSTSASRMPSRATPAGVRALVLGCTHYGLVTDRIVAALGGRRDGLRLARSPSPARPCAASASHRTPPRPRRRRRGRAAERPGRRGPGLLAAPTRPAPACWRASRVGLDSRHEHDAS